MLDNKKIQLNPVDIPDNIKKIQLVYVNLLKSWNAPVMKHKITEHKITIIVLKNVAKLELTSLMPIFAKIVVIEVKNAANKANNNQIILS